MILADKVVSLILGLCIASILILVAEDSKPSPLTSEEQDHLVILLMQAQSARIVMLEKLASKTAGSDDINLADQASQAYTTALRALIKKHSAGDTCQWNFISKAWVCPTPAPAPPAEKTPEKPADEKR